MIATWVGIFVVVVTLWYTRVGVGAAVEAAEHGRVAAEYARRMYVAEHRAWMKVTPIEARVRFRDAGKVRVEMSFRATNVGRSPAIDVYLGAAPFQARRFLVARAALDKVMEEERRWFDAPGIMHLVLLPGDSEEHGFSADAKTHPSTEGPIEEQIARGVQGFEDARVSISVAVVVFYRSTVSEDVCHTAHVFWLRKIDNTEFDPALGDVPAENIQIQLLPMESRIT